MKTLSKEIRFHLTNVVGAGASQLLGSLLPALEMQPGLTITHIYLPCRGSLSSYLPTKKVTRIHIYHRFLPNFISRFLECIFFTRNFDGDTPLIVFGDLPLRVNCYQVLFLQNSHLIPPASFRFGFGATKFLIMRYVFRLNLNYVDRIVVQSNLMRSGLLRQYPSLEPRIFVISQPPPKWLIDAEVKRYARLSNKDEELDLIYPATYYPHKNHGLLNQIIEGQIQEWPIKTLKLTINQELNPAPYVTWIECIGLSSSSELIEQYKAVDALVFLSIEESYGFPLLEAMFVGIPIVCPDLSYARNMCGNEAIYFDPFSVDSLKQAIIELKRKLDSGWWPNWSGALKNIACDWDETANQFLSVLES